ncbi:MAG: hypothetical protein WD967_00805 [Candidatus Levyibacteriota bacterium]
MNGPYILNTNTISTFVTSVSPGAYILSTDGLKASYIGRSDGDVGARLKTWTGKGYTHFWFDYATSPKAAFDLECIWGHSYLILNNLIHPARPTNSGWQCPRCNIFQTP